MNDARTMVTVAGMVFVLLVGVLLGGFWFKASNVQGSIETGEEYNATTTGAFFGQSAENVLKTGGGSLAQVTLTGANTGDIYLYNATTSNVTKRTGSAATSSLLLAEFHGGATTGTYTFDAAFTAGLLLVLSGTEATSTITWR